jgi:beta-1,4-mannosyltransferase
MMQRVSNTSSKPFGIACWPVCLNPYQHLFYSALKDTRFFGSAVINDRWLKSNAHEFDALHIHWPENLWRRRGKGAMGALRVIGVRRYLKLAKCLGLKLIWTVHNLEHHEGVNWIDRLGYRILAKESDLVICHSHYAAEALIQRDRPAGRVVIMPHGNYDGIYPPPRPRNIVLKELGLNPERPVVCCLGRIRYYKGIDIAIEALRSLSGQIQLIIGGSPDYDVRALAKDLNGAAQISHKLSEQQFADTVGASEAVLLPYRKITGSGVLLAAWTLGCGVVASDLPYFQEISKPEPDSARFFPVGNSAALAGTILEYLSIPFQTRERAVRRLADRYKWEYCVEPVAQVIDEWRTG